MISSWIFDEFIICATIFLIPPVSALSFPLCVPHPPANCVNITHFHLIYQGILQRIFGMLSVKIGPFLTMLRCFCLLSRYSWEQLLQQSPHPSMQPLHPALRSSSVLSLQDTSQYNHLELEIHAIGDKVRFSSISFLEIILHALAQNNDLVRIFCSIFFALVDKLRAKS